MYKKFFLCSVVFAALSMSFVSCSEDEADGKGDTNKKQSTTVGALSSGTALDNDLPEGYRISSVDDYRFYYDEKGRLEAISIEGEYINFENGTLNFRMEEDGEYYSYKVGLNKDNLIASISMSYTEEYGDDYDKENGTATFTYNSNKQLTKISIKLDWEEYEDGEKEKGTYTDDFTLTYSGKILTKVKDSYVEKEDGDTYSGTYNSTFDYDDEYPNNFFQYTPGLLYPFDDDFGFEPFFYLGLFGRASSMLPTRVYTVDIEDGETWEDEDDLGPYRYNSYGALSSADGYTYRYTSVDTRATNVLDVWNVPTTAKVNPFKGLFQRPSQRHHKNHK